MGDSSKKSYLETVTPFSFLPDHIQDTVDQLCALSIVSLGPVVT